jgi:hypothetical protein
MNFEFVEFYPDLRTDKNYRERKFLGTVHIYCIDHQIDLRGLPVTYNQKKIKFSLPYYRSRETKTREKIFYPFFCWGKQEDMEEMESFLYKKVMPIIKKYIEENLKTPNVVEIGDICQEKRKIFTKRIVNEIYKDQI